MRLVAAQDGNKILDNLKQYIKKLGYDNVEVIVMELQSLQKHRLIRP